MGGNSNSVDAQLAGVQIQTSLLGQPLPMGWGRGRISCNLVDYIGFKAIPKTTTTGKGGGSSTTYTYTASIILAICEGPITGIRTVYKDSSVFVNGATTALAQAKLSVALGTLTQAPWGYLTSLYPSHAIGYSQTAYAYAQDYPLSSGASLSNHGFEVDFGIQFAGLASGDADPASIVTDYLTNATYGVTGWGSGLLGNWTQWSNSCIANGIFLSPVLDSQTKGSDFLTQIANETNGEFFWSEGVLKAGTYFDTAKTGNGVTFTPNLAPLFDLNENHFLDEVMLEIVDQTDAYNYVQVEWLDRSNQYQTAVAIAQDLDNIVTYGLRKRDPESFHHICDANVAQQVVQLRLQRVLYTRDKYTFTLPEDFVGLEPMDYVTISTSVDSLLLNRQLVIIQELHEQADGAIDVIAYGVPGYTASAALYQSHTASSFASQVDTPPGNAATPLLFAGPAGLIHSAQELWMATDGGANWGGCNVWVSFDNASYSNVGTVSQGATYGVASAALANNTDPDTTDTLSVDLTTSFGTLGTITATAADAGGNLCYFDGEVIAYANATMTAAYKYDLTYLRRGYGKTAIEAHAIGAPFAYLDAGIFKLPYSSDKIGRTAYIKLQSVNLYGRAAQDISALTPYTITLPAPPALQPSDVYGFTYTVDPNIGASLVWTLDSDLVTDHYEIRQGATWAAGTAIASVKANRFKLGFVYNTALTYWIKAVSTDGTYSVNAFSCTVAVSAPAAVAGLSSSVIDNNVLLQWTAPASTYAIARYEIRTGATFATAAVRGSVNGTFIPIFETNAATYTYWVVAVDITGNYGTPVSLAVTVAAPPDYKLLTSINSTLSGTVVNGAFDTSGALVMPVVSETFQAHFTAHSWASPQDQITAGYPMFIEPAAATASYEEVIDYGTTIAACKVTAAATYTTIGAPGITPKISISNTSATGPWTDYPGVSAAYASNFRWVKIHYDITSTGADIVSFSGLNIRLDAKQIEDFGTVSAVSTDTTGTVVSFGKPFVAVTAIHVDAQGTTSLTAVYDFVSVPNPTSFKVYLFNSAGTRVSGTVSWTAKGY